MTVSNKIQLRGVQRRELRQRLNQAVSEIFGYAPPRHNLDQAFWGAFAASLAESVHTAFLVKSAHGTDNLGNSWSDLSPKTKAYSRPDARVGIPLPGPKSRPTLDATQDKIWRGIYASTLAHLRTQVGEAEAVRRAAQSAWAIVKSRFGAHTLLELTRDKLLLLLQRSHKLVNSVAPGVFNGQFYQPPTDQVFEVDHGLTWGSKVEYADEVSKKRPIWPADIDPWLDLALEAGIIAVINVLEKALRAT